MLQHCFLLLSWYKIYAYLRLMRLNKPIGIFLLLWPTLMALWIAGKGKPRPFIVLIFILGVVVMRSAGCVINDWADRALDGAVRRTQNRPLVTGEVTPKESILLFVGLLAIAFILVLQLNMLTFALSPIGLILAILYPFMKRYIHFPQVVLGAAFGWAIPMAFTALESTYISQAVLLYLATLVWALIYDTQYAMADREEDMKVGIKSTAIWLGNADRLVIGILQCSLFIVLLGLGISLHCGLYYFGGLFCASLLALYQQYLIRHCQRENCFKAFLNNNMLGASLFMGLALDYGLGTVA